MWKKILESPDAIKALSRLAETTADTMERLGDGRLSLNPFNRLSEKIGNNFRTNKPVPQPTTPPPPSPPTVKKQSWANHPIWTEKPEVIDEKTSAFATGTTDEKENTLSVLSPRLQKLIEVALKDGVVTDAELAVLVRKAKEENVDADELIMIVNAHLYDLQEQAKTEAAKAKPKAGPPPLPGKCPSCGAMNKMTASVCEECGARLNPIAPPPLPGSMPQSTQESVCKKDHLPVVALAERLEALNEQYDDDLITEKKLAALRESAITLFGLPESVDEMIEYLELACEEYDSIYAEDDEMLIWQNNGAQIIRIILTQYPRESSDYSREIKKAKETLEL